MLCSLTEACNGMTVSGHTQMLLSRWQGGSLGFEMELGCLASESACAAVAAEWSAVEVRSKGAMGGPL